MSAFYAVNIETANNADFRQSFIMKDTAGVAVDLTGATFEMDIRDIAGAELISATTANGRILNTAPTTGAFAVVLPAAALLPLEPGVYAHDLIMRQGGETSRVWSGAFVLVPGVTR